MQKWFFTFVCHRTYIITDFPHTSYRIHGFPSMTMQNPWISLNDHAESMDFPQRPCRIHGFPSKTMQNPWISLKDHAESMDFPQETCRIHGFPSKTMQKSQIFPTHQAESRDFTRLDEHSKWLDTPSRREMMSTTTLGELSRFHPDTQRVFTSDIHIYIYIPLVTGVWACNYYLPNTCI